MPGYGQGPYGQGVYGSGSSGSSTAWIPATNLTLNGRSWFRGDVSSSPVTTPVYSNTLVIPAYTVPSALTDFPVRVKINLLTPGWKAGLKIRGPDTIRVRDQVGTDLSFDLIWVDVVTGEGDLYFKASKINRLFDTYFTIELVSGELAPAPTDPLGRNAVWSDYDAVFMDGYTTNRTGNGNDLLSYTPNESISKWFNFTGTLAATATISNHTSWVVGGTYRTDGTAQAGLVSYTSSSPYSVSNRAEFALDSGTTPAIWNSTDGWLYEGAPTYSNGSSERFNFQRPSIPLRQLYRNGLKVNESPASTRPGGLGDRLVLGASDVNVATAVEPFTGAMNRVYLRNGELSDSWIYAERVSWEDPLALYQISEDPVPPPITASDVWWDGTNYQPAQLIGWWNGSSLQPLTILGEWDGATIQPIVPAS